MRLGMKLFLTALSACLFFAMPAEARKLVAVAPECNITMPCEGVGRGDVSRTVERRVGRKIVRTADTVYRAAIARPLAFVGGRLNCARAVNAHLAASGRAGTGSARAASFASWGSPSEPVPGAVARYRCCGPSGHVAIVSHVDSDGSVWVWNPTPRGWQLRRQFQAPIEYRA